MIIYYHSFGRNSYGGSRFKTIIINVIIIFILEILYMSVDTNSKDDKIIKKEK